MGPPKKKQVSAPAAGEVAAKRQSSKPSAPSAVAAAALSKRRNDSQQTNLGFGAKEKYFEAGIAAISLLGVFAKRFLQHLDQNHYSPHVERYSPTISGNPLRILSLNV
jgi:hypothetical protein